MNTYQDLIAWQKARKLVAEVYRFTKHFPEEERFGLTSQMRRAAVSIPSNLAEGFRRMNRSEWRQFIRYSYGSASELETQMILASDIGFVKNQPEFQACQILLTDVLKLLNRLLQSLQ